MGTLLPIILGLLPPLLRGAETFFAAKPKSGTDKANAVLQALQAFLSQYIASGAAPAGTPLPDPAATPAALRLSRLEPLSLASAMER